MSSFGRHITALVAALAVFVVGVTCTPAGCLLPVRPTHAGVVRPCCEGHSGPTGHSRSSEHGPNCCPVCDQPLFTAGGLAKSVHPLAPSPVAVPFLAIAPSAFSTSLALERAAARSPHVRPPSVEAPTLLALACSFLT